MRVFESFHSIQTGCLLAALAICSISQASAQEATPPPIKLKIAAPYWLSASDAAEVSAMAESGRAIPLWHPTGPTPPPENCSNDLVPNLPAPPAGTGIGFKGLQCLEAVGPYYGGGKGGLGSGPGPNLGIQFSCNALAASVPPAACPLAAAQGAIINAEYAPSAPNVVFWLTGTNYVMNVPGGFSEDLHFRYAAPFAVGSVIVWDGVNGGGKQLAKLALAETGSCAFPHQYCDWNHVHVNFKGTARSITFGGTANYIAFDNIQLGTAP